MSIDSVAKHRLAEHPNQIKEAVMAGASHPPVIIYTTPTCPDCWALKAWLAREGMAFEERDLTDPTPVLSEASVGARWRSGFVTDAIATDLQDFDGWKAYVAGPPPMLEAAMQISTAPLRSGDLHADVFFTPREVSARKQVPGLSGDI